jgi:hypothetical protein
MIDWKRVFVEAVIGSLIYVYLTRRIADAVLRVVNTRAA